MPRTNRQIVKDTITTGSVTNGLLSPYQAKKFLKQLFNVSTSTFDGVFHGNTAQEMTINEAMSRINKWLGRKE